MQIIRSRFLVAILLVACGALAGVHSTIWYSEHMEHSSKPALAAAPIAEAVKEVSVAKKSAPVNEDEPEQASRKEPVARKSMPAHANVIEGPLPLPPIRHVAALGAPPPDAFPNALNLKLPVPAPPVGTKAMDTVRYLKSPDAMLEYDIRKVGPSGIGVMEVWLTKDDGKTWSPLAEFKAMADDAKVGQKTISLREKDGEPFADGAYGLTLVVKSRAGGGRVPQANDRPQIRVVIDTKAPDVRLFNPEADPDNHRAMLFKWFASDANLAVNSITLEYAEKVEGPWLPIAGNLANKTRFAAEKGITGDFTCMSELRSSVYIRLRVRDMAGNESTAMTRESIWLDVTVPEGVLTNIRSKVNQRRE